MDYLQEAIERARKEGKSGIGKTPKPGKKANAASRPATLARSGDSIGNITASVGRQSQSLQNSAEPVEYTKTRKVELERAMLLQNRVIAGDVDDPRVEAYRQLRSHVLSAMKKSSGNTLAITSPQEGAGKSTTAVNLAISMSWETNHTVMLVDLDLRKPNVHTILNIEVEKGIVDHLKSGEPIENILVNPGYSRLVVLPGLPQGHHASELLTSRRMQSFMSDITQRYPERIIIFDLPPLLRNDDAMVFVPSADICLLVVEDGATTPEELERSLELLKDAELLGTVLNKARP